MKLNIWDKEINDLSLLDEEFLIALFEQKERDLYARIASLDYNEQPIEYIEGRISDGSINIDGDSSVRRTCQLTMTVADVDIGDIYWGVKTKFKLEIGLKNNLTNEYAATKDNEYPDIVWFPEGTYLITNFTTAITTKGYTISLSGKDKMSMLNGELGGQIFASTDFGKESYEETTFIPIAAGEANAELLMNQTLYKKDDLAVETGYVLSNDPDYKFIPNSDGQWIRFENRYYRLADFVLDLNADEFSKEIEVPLSGNYFIPEFGGNYIYTPENENDWDTVGEITATDFPAAVNLDHTKICILRQENNSSTLKTFYFTVTQIVNFKSKRYESYIMIKHPNEMFRSVDVTSFQYEPNVYYFEKNYDTNQFGTTNYFTLDTRKNRTLAPELYYELLPLYRLDSEVTLTKIPLEKIIREMIHAYALEPYHNIIINDLDEYGLEQLRYIGDAPLYAFMDPVTGEFIQLAFIDQNSNSDLYDEINSSSFKFVTLTEGLTGNGQAGSTVTRNFKYGNISRVINYKVAKIEYGQDVGYRITNLTYTGDLITSIGDSITSVLDKIKEMLGEFEYFYDTEGHFIFQKKKTYVNTSWSFLTDNGDENYVDYFANSYKKYSFNFEGNRLVTAFNNAPNLTNLKNDFSIWGKKKGTLDKDIPIHARYAIDRKPKEYLAFNGILYYTEEAIANPSPTNASRIGGTSTTTIAESEFKRMAIIPDILKKVDDEGNILQESDWWELSDWARYYHALTGADPAQQLRDYGTEGFTGILRFGDDTSYNFIGTGQLIIDFDKSTALTPGGAPRSPLYEPRTATGDYVRWWSPFMHTFTGCGHWYQQYLGFYSLYPDMISFIYKPKIPDASIIEKDGGRFRFASDGERLVDWRELIYRMAIDYFAGQGCSEKEPIYSFKGDLVINNPDHFLSAVAIRNPDYYGTGYTGYEQYYTDMQGFWRQLYNPDYVPIPQYEGGSYETVNVSLKDSKFFQKQKIWQPEHLSGYQIDYYVDSTIDRARTYYENARQDYETDPENALKKKIFDDYSKYYINYETNADIAERKYWNKNVFEAPESLNFWIEFLDDTNELAEYSIPVVGDRSKVVNEDKVSVIYYRDVPGLILCLNRMPENTNEHTGWKLDTSELREAITDQSGYKFIYMPRGYAKFFDISYRSLSAKNKIDELIYQFAYCIENVTITGIPIYNLEPNTLIFVRDDITKIFGEYIVKKISLPLKPGGTMNITAIKAPQRMY